MNESRDGSSAGAESVSVSRSPGAMLRALRERQGVHIGVLATTLKVTPRKLELLEADRFGELPDATFVRALALAVCRALKTDPAEVMAAYAAQDLATDPFKDVGKGINEPMRSPARGPVLPADLSLRTLPLKGWLALVVVAAVVVWLVVWMVVRGWGSVQAQAPDASIPTSSSMAPSVQGPAPAVSGDGSGGPAAALSSAALPSSATSPAAGSPPSVLEGPSTPAALRPSLSDEVQAAPPVSAVAAEASLMVSASADTWLEVVDGTRRVVWSQVLPEGDSVQLAAVPPMQIVIGNARATRLMLNGQAVDLAAHVRGNVARLQLP